MKGRFIQFGADLRESYWFVPSLMAIGALLLAGGMILLDSYQGSGWMDGVPWLYAARPSGARSLLSSIGGSMIGVAGTTFSVTIAAVVYASGQYGPRLLSNFMSDRGNQVTLGTFIATFLYSMVVLRTIRSPGESGTGASAFVPQLAVLVAVALMLCSVGVLIFFIHHVPSKIYINNVIEDIGDRLLRGIGDRFPSFIGSPQEVGETALADAIPETFRHDADPARDADRRLIASLGTGYIELVDDDAIMAQASAHDLILRLQYQPGDFTHRGRALVEAWPADRCNDKTAKAISTAFSIGARRSALQDLRFLIDELVEIAARALSPGVNDPFTAVTCLDWLGAALSDLAPRELPSHLRADEDGALRVITHPETFATFVDRAFGALAQYAATDMVAGLRYLRALGEVAIDCADPERLATLADQAGKFETLASEALTGFNLERIRERAKILRKALQEPDYKRRLRDSTAWLGGTA